MPTLFSINDNFNLHAATTTKIEEKLTKLEFN